MTLKDRARSWLGIQPAPGEVRVEHSITTPDPGAFRRAQSQIRADMEQAVKERAGRKDSASSFAAGTVAAMETLISENFDALTCLAGIAHCADDLLDCLNEFAPEYPQACSEYCQALDDALARGEAAHYFTRKGQP